MINAAAVRAEAIGRPLLNLCHGLFSACVVAASPGVAAVGPGGDGQPWSLVVVGALIVAAAGLLAVATPEYLATPAVGAPGRKSKGSVPSWPLVSLGGLAAVAYLVENAWQSWAAIQLDTSTDASARTAAAAPAVFAGAAALGRFAGHGLARVSPAVLVAVGALTAAGGTTLAALASRSAVGLAGIAVAGLGTAVCAPTLISLARHHADPADHGAATGTVVTIA